MIVNLTGVVSGMVTARCWHQLNVRTQKDYAAQSANTNSAFEGVPARSMLAALSPRAYGPCAGPSWGRRRAGSSRRHATACRRTAPPTRRPNAASGRRSFARNPGCREAAARPRALHADRVVGLASQIFGSAAGFEIERDLAQNLEQVDRKSAGAAVDMAKLERLAKWHFVAAHTIRQHA
jgi:hypothetical protein